MESKFGWINRIPKNGMMYEGDINNIDTTIDSSVALSYSEGLKELGVKFIKINIEVYGKSTEHSFPIIHKNDVLFEKIKDLPSVSGDFHDYLAKLAQHKMISDHLLGLRHEVLKKFYIVEYSIPTHSSETSTPSSETSTPSTSSPSSLSPSSPSSPSTPKIVHLFIQLENNVEYAEEKEKLNEKLSQSAIIMMKEYLDGLYMGSDYSLSINTQGSKKKIDFNLKRDYEVTHPLTNEPIIIKDNYTNGLRYSIFSDPLAAKGLTTSSRPLLQARQYDLIKRRGKRTCFVCPRRQGKTLFMISDALSFIMRNNPKSKIRPTTVLFLGLSDKNLQPAINYLLKMKQSFGEIGDQIFHYDSKFNVFSFKEGKDTIGQINFLSCEGRNPGIGYFADAVYIDEAHLVPRDIYNGIEPIITHEGASLMAGSTMYKNVKKGWFYELLTQYEKSSIEMQDIDKIILEHRETGKPFEHFSGLRYTIDDNEFLTEQEKDAVKIQYSNDPERYLAELYSRFPDEGKIFKYEGSVAQPELTQINNYEYLCYGYDPALTSDKSALLLGAYNKHINKLVFLEENQLNKIDKTNFGQQIKMIKQIREVNKGKYINNPVNDFLVMDGTQKSTAELVQMHDVNVDLRIAYHSGINISKTNIYNESRVPKKYLIDIAQILFDNDRIIISSSLKTLMGELDCFYDHTNDSTGSTKYEGKGSNDDFVNAMMMIIYYFYEHMGLKYTLIKDRTKILSAESVVEHITIKDIRALNADKVAADKEAKMKEANRQYRKEFIW